MNPAGMIYLAEQNIDDFLPDKYDACENSVRSSEGTLFAMVEDRRGNRALFVSGRAENKFEGGESFEEGTVFPLTLENARKLSEFFSWLKPKIAGSDSAFGCGDRIGLATPGHIRAVEKGDVVPVLAQQSIREMERTGRNPRSVLNTAVWGVFREGFEEGFVADADHLKSRESVEKTASAGYTMFTCDPSEEVENEADRMSSDKLESKFSRIDDSEELVDRYIGKEFTATLDKFDYKYESSFSWKDLMGAAVKYYDAVLFADRMYNWVDEKVNGNFDFEVSVDETENPTSPLEHIFVANELLRRGVNLTSLAPRFVGDIQKAIDYIGDLEKFEEAFKAHCAIAETLGPYKLSLHSGSDKFSIYPIISKYAKDKIHVKTAGTSYLEALRVIAKGNPDLFRRICRIALERFPEDRATYHMTTDLSRIPDVDSLDDDELPELLDQDDSRQVLHVTYGSVLSCEENGEPLFKDELKNVLRKNEERYFSRLKDHIGHHLDLLAGRS